VISLCLSAAQPPAPAQQSVEEAHAKSVGCMTCHTATDRHTMHQNPGVVLGCADCHGGDAKVGSPKGRSARTRPISRRCGVRTWCRATSARGSWPSSATPPRTYTLLNRESPEFVRFMNPGDLRAAREACGACHLAVIQASERSLMATSAMLWGGAAYNNGILPYKRYILGEAYTPKGRAPRSWRR
jgi:hypothetical protein